MHRVDMRSRLNLGLVSLGLAGLLGFANAATPALHRPSQVEHFQHADSVGDRLVIRQFDVGQGDAALITTPAGRRVLIDAGPNATQVARLLANEGIDTLHLVIASHNHADHIGGMPEVFSRLVVRAYLDNGVSHTTSIYRRTLTALEREPELQYLNATARTITLGSVTLRILPPPRFDRTQNNNSVGVIIEYGQFRALYSGDSERPELLSWLRKGTIPKVTFLKAAHHGSFNGITRQWMRTTHPEIVAISVGAENTYRHPSPRTLSYWKSINSRVFRTDRDGTLEVQARADGKVTMRTGLSSQLEERR